MTIGSPYNYALPKWISHRLAFGGRKGKDVLDPLFRLFNATKIYEIALKSSPRYWTFITTMSIVASYAATRGIDRFWERINKGKLYKDLGYVYPPEDDE